YAQDRVDNSAARWNDDAFRPEVFKAVLMNSADKVEGRLGMRKTIYDARPGNSDWDSSDAADIPSNDEDTTKWRQSRPLDLYMGAGQLNVQRALTQYRTGEYHPVGAGNTLPAEGWDLNTINGQNSERTYQLP